MAAKVLLVEDDNNLREIYEARLMAEGYNIVTAKDGEEALVVAKAETPDLVISDVMMPRISGFEMLDILRNTEALRDTKVIMLTALGQADDKTRANSLGADRYLVKSQVTLEDIVKAAHELLEGTSPEAPAAAVPAPSAAPIAAPSGMPVAPATPTPVAAAPVVPAPIADAPVVPAPVFAPTTTVPAPSLSVQPELVTAPATLPPAPVATPPSAVTPQAASPAFNPTLGATFAQPATPTVSTVPSLATPPAPVSTTAFPTPASGVLPVATAPDLNAAASTSDEQATVGAQIDNFVRSTQPAVEAEPAAANEAQDDAVLADAVNDLATNAEEKATESTPAVVTPTMTSAPAPAPLTPSTPTDPPAAPTAINDNVAIANKKIIQPITAAEPKVGIHELLAREEAAGSAAVTAPTTPATTFSPNIMQPQASPAVQATPATFGPAPAPAAPAKPNDFDPNNIAL